VENLTAGNDNGLRLGFLRAVGANLAFAPLSQSGKPPKRKEGWIMLHSLMK